MSEFDIIEKYFKQATAGTGDNLVVGIGDDAAVVTVPDGMQLVISMDTLVSGVHFNADADARDIGYKSLAVNLSDMAAMGAEPVWATMSLTLPDIDHDWLEKFMAGFRDLANKYKVGLIGGDMSRGPLSITIQIHGLLPTNKAIRRNGASAGDLLYVTGFLGDAGFALQLKEGDVSLPESERHYFLQRLNRPLPRVEAGMALRGFASSAIDISDGLLADLGHVLDASSAGAVLYLEKLPISAALKNLEPGNGWDLALTAGDDYELCFTVPLGYNTEIETRLRELCPVTCIGEITEKAGIQCIGTGGSVYKPAGTGYLHF